MKYFLKSSAQHGRGVFASTPILAGETILEFTGPVLSRHEINEQDYHLQIDEGLYLGASGAADDYVNHSCEPNAGFRNGLILIAIRNISAGEEITWDYSTAIDEQDFQGFRCYCGATQCRGVIRSFRDLSPDIQKRLKPWLLPYLVKKYFSGI